MVRGSGTRIGVAAAAVGLLAIVGFGGRAVRAPARLGLGARPGLAGTSASSPVPAAGSLLVAKRGLGDPNFAQSVVLLLQYGTEQGAVGLVVNRPVAVPLEHVLPELDPPGDLEVFWGGPVSGGEVFLLVRADTAPEQAQKVFGEVYLSRSLGLLRTLLDAGDASRYRVFFGYAGWAPGQLDAEIERGDWEVLPGSADRVFDETPAGLWQRLAPRDPSNWARHRSRPTVLG